MKRSYYLVQTLEAAKQLQTSLLKASISKEQIHMLCKNDSELAAMGLNELPLTQRKDIFSDIEYGGLIGILIGLLIAIGLIPLGADTIDLTPVVFSGIAFAFGFVGIVLGGLIGLTRENYHISEFRDQISGKQCVVMIDSAESDAKLAQLLSTSGVALQYLKEEDDDLHLEEATKGVPMTM
ncbi:MAG: hypothetical protein JKY01_08415 [Pseudomonadales bacterium]|nr:hypothetical protein [Pseudomonadales bacterium]